MSRIIRNAIQCNFCNQVVESKHRHDFRECRCGRVFVDGGKSYLRRGFKHESDFEDLSEFVDDDKLEFGDENACRE